MSDPLANHPTLDQYVDEAIEALMEELMEEYSCGKEDLKDAIDDVADFAMGLSVSNGSSDYSGTLDKEWDRTIELVKAKL